jgi:hypothetical protein
VPVELRAGRRIRRIRRSLGDLGGLAPEVGRDICVLTVDDAPDDILSLNTACVMLSPMPASSR